MEDQLKEILANIFNIQKSDINEDSSPETIVAWDSLKHMQLIIMIEEALSITITPEEIAEMVDFKKIKEIILEKSKN
ncbi:MAG: hypothetical protein COA79_17135 [Planctomycetota bacterium]|nr:MAG: hypothetical protein COA79_17135 [Planctomycetota bacterium]